MKNTLRVLALTLGASTLLSLAACTDPEGTDGTTTTGASETTTSASETTTDASATVTPPTRYDYFTANVSADVSFSDVDYGSLQLTLPASLQVTDKDVADYVAGLRYQKRTVEGEGKEVTDRPLKWGDSAYIFYKGEVDGEAFDGGSNWDEGTPYNLGLGSMTFIEGFEEGLVGLVPKDVTRENPYALYVTFPEDYQEASLAGKEAVFYVAVMYSIPYTLPDYNRDFVVNTLGYEPQKTYYASDAALLAEFEAYTKSYLEEQMSSTVEKDKIDALWSHLVENVACENLPSDEVEYYRADYEEEIHNYYDYYKSVDSSFSKAYPTEDDFAREYWGLSQGADWRAFITEKARKMVKKDMIVHAIAEAEGMEEISDADYTETLNDLEDYYSGYMTAEELEEILGEATIRELALSDRVEAWLLERTTFTFEE